MRTITKQPFRQSIEELNVFFDYWDAPVKAISYCSDVGEKNQKVNFKCREQGCEFTRPLSDVKKNIEKAEGRAFCTVCSNRYFHEEKVRFILEQYLETKFSKARPSWLKDERFARSLELDGLSDNEKIAFEYQGEQHYRAFGHISESDVEKIKEKDKFKVKVCREKSVKLIVIEAEEFGGDIEDQINKALEQLDIPKKSNNVNWSKFKMAGAKTTLAKAQLHAARMGYTLVLPEPLTSSAEDFKFKCANPGHRSVQAKLISPNRGRPACRECSREKRNRREKAVKNKSPAELQESGKACEPPMLLQKWAGIDGAGAHLYKCSSCGDVRAYKDKKILAGRGKKVCINCPPNRKPRVQLFKVMERAYELGGECLSTSVIKLTKESKLTFKCFNVEHSEFELTIKQLMDSDMWCDQPPCNSRKKKRRKISSEEIVNEVSTAFPYLRFSCEPTDGQSSPLKLSCAKCGYEGIRGASNAELTYKSLSTYGKLECSICKKKLGEGWKRKIQTEE